MQSKPFQKQDIIAPNHQTLSTCHIMANLKESCVDRRCCSTLLIKAVIAPVMQSGYEDENCAGLDEQGPRGPAAQSGLRQSPAFLSLSEGHRGSIGNCLLSTERARKFINTLLFILKILQKTEHLLKSQNDGFIDFPVAHQHSHDPAALTNTGKSFLPLCLLFHGLAWYEFLYWLIL